MGLFGGRHDAGRAYTLRRTGVRGGTPTGMCTWPARQQHTALRHNTPRRTAAVSASAAGRGASHARMQLVATKRGRHCLSAALHGGSLLWVCTATKHVLM